MATFQAMRVSVDRLRTACAWGLICCIVLATPRGLDGGTALVSSLVTVVFKADKRPVANALADVRSKDKVLDERRTDGSGTVKFAGLEANSGYRFTARKSGFRREYAEKKGGEKVNFELVKKYGPPVDEGE